MKRILKQALHWAVIYTVILPVFLMCWAVFKTVALALSGALALKRWARR